MKLKPCPFCGGEAELREGETKMEEGVVYPPFVHCKSCGSTRDSVDAWNRRKE